MLESRIFQHRTHKSSHIYKHISNCTQYQSALNIEYGSGPTLAQQRDFISTHFKILEKKNLYNYFARVTHEGLMITFQTPDLNRQQKHKSMSLVCECIKSKFTDSSKFIDDTGI